MGSNQIGTGKQDRLDAIVTLLQQVGDNQKLISRASHAGVALRYIGAVKSVLACYAYAEVKTYFHSLIVLCF